MASLLKIFSSPNGRRYEDQNETEMQNNVLNSTSDENMYMIAESIVGYINYRAVEELAAENALDNLLQQQQQNAKPIEPDHLDTNVITIEPASEVVVEMPTVGNHEITTNLSFLEEVYIDVSWSLCVESTLILSSWLQVFIDLKSVAVPSSTVKVLCFLPDIWNAQSSGFGNLNSLEAQFKKSVAQVPVKSQKVKLKSSSPL